MNVIAEAINHARSEISARAAVDVVCWNIGRVDDNPNRECEPWPNVVELIYRGPGGEHRAVRCKYCDGDLELAKAECLSAVSERLMWEAAHGRRRA